MAEIASGSQVYGVDFPPSQSDHDWTAAYNLTNTNYIVGAPEVAVSVTAPTSGRVLVCVGGGFRNNVLPSTNERVIITYQVLEDSSEGPLFTSPSAYRGIISCGVVAQQEFYYRGNMSLETNLIPGRQYYFQVVYRTVNGAGSGDISSRDITVIPVP